MKNFNPFKKSEAHSLPREEKVKHMKMSSVLLIGYRNIAINRTRSLLTIGGVSIGIGVITFLISLGF